MFTLLDFGVENRIVVMTISTIPMRQNRSISIFFQFEGGSGQGANYELYIHIRVLIMTHFHMASACFPQRMVGLLALARVAQPGDDEVICMLCMARTDLDRRVRPGVQIRLPRSGL